MTARHLPRQSVYIDKRAWMAHNAGYSTGPWDVMVQYA